MVEIYHHLLGDSPWFPVYYLGTSVAVAGQKFARFWGYTKDIQENFDKRDNL
jgi:hypothetical protein